VPKKIDRSAQIGDAGIALIHRQVNQMGYVWREKGKDAGVDGEIEFRDAVTGEVSNRRLLVQSKASENRFAGETDRSFHYVCKDADVDYWMNADRPVILVCSHPSADEAWWVHVQPWFSDPAHRASRRIEFDKATQRLDDDAAQRMLDLADPQGRPRTETPLTRPETLESNLLPVALPPQIYSAPCTAHDDREVHEALREADSHRVDWVRRDGRMYSFSDPNESSLKLVITGPIDAVPADTFIQSEPNGRRLVAWLLSGTLKQDTAADLDWHRDGGYLYFRATPDLTTRKIAGGSGKLRIVFQPKLNMKGNVSYYMHHALRYRFISVADDWYCTLVPEYHYTRDGQAESRFAASLRSGIKRIEKNAAVRGQVRMWAAYLRRQDDLTGLGARVLEFGQLVTFDTGVGIDDRAWSTDPEAVALSDDADEWTLFEDE
jgi:hypothetical protein